MLVAWGSPGSGSTAGFVEASADGVPSRARKGGAKPVRRWSLAAGSALWLPALAPSAAEDPAPSPDGRSPTQPFRTRSFGMWHTLLSRKRRGVTQSRLQSAPLQGRPAIVEQPQLDQF